MSHFCVKISIIHLIIYVQVLHFPLKLQLSNMRSSIYKSIQSKNQYSFLQIPNLFCSILIFRECLLTTFFSTKSKENYFFLLAIFLISSKDCSAADSINLALRIFRWLSLYKNSVSNSSFVFSDSFFSVSMLHSTHLQGSKT